MKKRYICIHGHFYQPPRENPWLEEIELQDSAYPYHDWNEKITAQCYAPNTASRILDVDGRIIDIVNNYSQISFNFGPALLNWLERNKPEVYAAILEADGLSMQRFSGHGSAIAQIYNHMIMPLASRRDKYTQVIWGIRDFQKRFRRFPEGMWLPETAVDLETLQVLAELGIRFTILAPHQAKRIKRLEGSDWIEVDRHGIDTTMPYVCRLPSGKDINIFFYNGQIAQEVAFGGLLKNGEAFARRLLSAFKEGKEGPQIVHIATDGETYGHHHRYGDMALAYCLHHIRSNNLASITNYGEYLEKHPPTYEVEVIDNTSWSCRHGIERWKENCGCNTGMHNGWTQAWRRPLRVAMDRLRDRLVPLYGYEGSQYLKDPWGARNDYIEVIHDRSHENVERFIRTHASRELSREEKVRVLKLLELQRNAMLMYTSCGWFFDEISGIETTQVMQYAAQAMQYVEELLDISLEPEYVALLKKAPSNVLENGARVYDTFVKPARVDLLRVAAHYAISSIFEEYPEDIRIFCYSGRSEVYEKIEAGKVKFITGKARIISHLTLDEKVVSFAVLHLGDQNINGGVREFSGEERFAEMRDEMREAFEKGDIPEVIRLMDKHFNGSIYSLLHLFKDEQRKILDQVLQLNYEGIEASYRQIYENNYTLMNFFHSLGIPLPKPLSAAAEYIVNVDLKGIFEGEEIDIEKLDRLVNAVKRWSFAIDRAMIAYVASRHIDSLMETLYTQPEDVSLMEKIENILRLLKTLPLDLNLWKAQNLYFSIGKEIHGEMKERAVKGDNLACKWTDLFHKLGSYLHVKVA